MNEQNSIPVSKVQRATKFMSTGAKIGVNYLKHHTQKVFNSNYDENTLHQENAKDIYDALSNLKGSALKVAQMLSMDRNMLPQAYNDKFMMSQYSAPPLSYPLVLSTFKQTLGKEPYKIFDTFSKNAANAASIGQVHLATINEKKYAVKIQYPGVADSISSDLKMVKPIAIRMFNLKEAEISQYLEEVEGKLIEETDYELELKRGTEIATQCAYIPNLFFPKYYPEFSSKKILTMDWLEGQHLKEFLNEEVSQEIRNQIGQTLWDFYDFQINQLQQVHADPHPGNFLFTKDGQVGVIDFGCIKVIPDAFYNSYFRLLKQENVENLEKALPLFYELEFLNVNDTEKEKEFFIPLFVKMTNLLAKPFHNEVFDFSDAHYFDEIYNLSNEIASMKEIKDARSARGSKHGLYINRTYFGLYSILHDLGAKINITNSYKG